MSTLSRLTDNQLISLLESNKIHQLYRFLNEKIADEIIAELNSLKRKKRLKHKILQSIAVPLSDATNYPIILLWGVVGVVSISALSLLIGTAILAATSILIGFIYFYSNFKDIQKTEVKMNKQFQLLTLKNHAADEYLARQGLQIETIKSPPFKNKDKLRHIKESTYSGMLISTALFGTGFLGVNAVMTALSTTALLSLASGPWGLLIGLGVSMAIGIYFGYKQYQSLKQSAQIRHEHKTSSTLVDKKTDLCRSLQNQEIQHSQGGELEFNQNLTFNYSDKCKFALQINEIDRDNSYYFFKKPEQAPQHEVNSLPLVIGF